MDKFLNFDKKCRACMAEQEKMLSLFQIYEHDLTLADILRSCMQVQIMEDDNLPSHMCDRCISILTEFYNFTVVYEESDRQFISLLRNYQKLHFEDDDFLEDHTIIGSEKELNNSAFQPEVLLHIKDRSSPTTNSEEFCDINSYLVQNAKLKQEGLEESAELTEDGELRVYEITDSRDLHNLEDVSQERYELITKYECDICGEAHLYSTGFQQHMRTKHQITDIDCDAYATQVRVKTEVDVKSEIKIESLGLIHPDISVNRCDVCKRSFFNYQELQKHRKIHDMIKKFICDVCGRRFLRKTYLDDHMEGHSTERKYVCRFCGKAFRRRTVLRAHKRVHTHPNHYVCELCGRAFTNSSTLKTHRLLIHIRERNFKCMICNQSFPLKSTLNKHVIRHQKREKGEKGFDCSECHMQYRDKSSLKRHYDIKHLGKIVLMPCPDCPKKYTSKANLLKHRRKHHALQLQVEENVHLQVEDSIE